VRHRVPRHVAIALPLALAGLIALLVSGNALRPFQQITTIKAKMASKSDYFRDSEVKRLLLKHGIRVDIHQLGSRGVATRSLENTDVVFPSGQPSAKLILARLHRSVKSARPFVTPLVLATFPDYAETLEEAGVATPQKPQGSESKTLYYDLDMKRFMNLLDGKDSEGRMRNGADTWNGIGFDEHTGQSNKGRILVRTSNVCESNAAGTYLSILAFVKNRNIAPGVPDENDAKGAGADDRVRDVAREIKPMINLQGMAADEQADSYFSDLGESIAPISLIYEHQYLAHQIDYQRKHGRQDTRRVLLYPTPYALTEPQLISLTDVGDKLSDLTESDPELRQRAIRLGFRVRFSGEDGTSAQLNEYLRERGIQVPTPNSDKTKVDQPEVDVLETIIDHVGKCPPAVEDTP
jgi:hypothetical protein